MSVQSSPLTTLPVYIAPDGALGYTTAHTDAKPEGSILTGWVREISNAGGAPITLANAGQSIMACPVADEDGVYQIFVQVDNSVKSPPCIYFQARTYTATRAVAWQY